MPKNFLVIVESPTKAKTISRFLPKNYTVKSSYGHIRDLPKSKFGIDVDNNFNPSYVVPEKAKTKVTDLKKIAKKQDEIIFATDEDREGEAIAYHLAHVLDIDPEGAKRIVFHEITKNAILNALENPREIDMNLVDAQQARRILDRIVGYKLSPFLWKKIRYGLSAGRVQSVAVRLIVEREKEIEEFKKEEYWTITGNFTKDDGLKDIFSAKLTKIDEKTLKKLAIQNKDEATRILDDLKNAKYHVKSVLTKERKRSPAPPFTTSTLQQEASRKFGFTAKKTMLLAQKLYEGVKMEKNQVGLITYMRTDSVNLSSQALAKAKEVIENRYGKEYGLETPRYYRKQSKNAQEAHEAIRPTSLERLPENVKPFLEKDMARLYDLIWKRTLACQMKEAIFDATRVDIETNQNTKKRYLFRANGNVLKFDGFTKVYTESFEDHDKKAKFFEESTLPKLTENESVSLQEIKKEQHFTEPPPRYNEATLVKTLEEMGIGRPSTYAPTINTIQVRGYVLKEDRVFKPTETGTLVNDVLVKHFTSTVDFNFTAKMEENLDKIAEDKIKWVPVIGEFYFPFIKNIEVKDKEISKKELTEEKTDEKCEKCGSEMVIKMGRFGRFYACSNYPKCKNTKPFGKEKEEQEELSNEKCDLCGQPMVLKRGRFGTFLGCSKYPDCKGTKKIEKKTGAGCLKCKKGDIVEKRSKKGRFFYGCNRYPDCDFAMWQKPTGKKCEKCGQLLVFKAGKKIGCSNKECDFEEKSEQ